MKLTPREKEIDDVRYHGQYRLSEYCTFSLDHSRHRTTMAAQLCDQLSIIIKRHISANNLPGTNETHAISRSI